MPSTTVVRSGIRVVRTFGFGLCLSVVGLSMAPSALAMNAECEKRIRDTGMIWTKDDPAIACEDNPSAEAQDCMVELLTQGKGKLRNGDFAEIYGLCRADAGKDVRDCVLKGLDKPAADPGYKGVRRLGDYCLGLKRKIPVKNPNKPEYNPDKKYMGRVAPVGDAVAEPPSPPEIRRLVEQIRQKQQAAGSAPAQTSPAPQTKPAGSQ